MSSRRSLNALLKLQHAIGVLRYRRTMLALCSIACFAAICTGQEQAFDYFGLAGPGNELKLFAPGVVSLKDVKEWSVAISPAGDEVFFAAGEWPKSKLMHLRKIEGRWTEPKPAEFLTDAYATEPSFSPDGKSLYFSSSKGEQDIKNSSIWRIGKVGDRWGEPRKAIDFEDPTVWEFHPSLTKDTLFFCRWDSTKQEGSIYKAALSGDGHSKPEKVTLFKTASSDANPFVDPEGKYLVAAAKPQGAATYEAYIFRKKSDGSWSEGINPGGKLDIAGNDDSFEVSPDGKFLFIYRDNDVYWTEAKPILGR